jgi:hypothetical protein
MPTMINRTLLALCLFLVASLFATAANATVTPNTEEPKQPTYKYKTTGSGFSFFPFLSIERIKVDTTNVKERPGTVAREEKIISSPAAF